MCSDNGLRIGNKYVEKSVFEMTIIMICFNNNINVVVFYFVSGGDPSLFFLVKTKITSSKLCLLANKTSTTLFSFFLAPE